MWLHKGMGEPFPGALHRDPETCGPETELAPGPQPDYPPEGYVFICPVNGGVYAISIDQGIMIKRFQVPHPEGKLRIISDNKQYPPQEIDATTLSINGKLIWYAREMER